MTVAHNLEFCRHRYRFLLTEPKQQADGCSCYLLEAAAVLQSAACVVLSKQLPA